MGESGVDPEALLAEVSAMRARLLAAETTAANFRALAEGRQNLLACADAGGRLVYVSPGCCALYGVPEADLLGRRFWPPAHTDDIEQVRAALRRLSEPPYETSQFERVETPQGVRWLSWACRATLDDAGQPTGYLASGHDVTEMHLAYRALAAGEARLRGLYESVQAGVVVQGADGRLIHANRAAAEIFCVPEGQIVGSSMITPTWRMVDEAGAPVPLEAFPSMLTARTGQPVRNAVCGVYTGKPERLMWLMLNTEPVCDPATGAVVEVVVTFLDITERIAAELALRESEARLRGLYESVQAGVAVVDREGRVLHANRAAAEILDLPMEQVLQLSFARPTWPLSDENGAEVPPEEFAIVTTLRTGQPVRNAVRGLAIGQPPRQVWLLINTEPVFDPAGGALREVVVTFSDITPRVLADQALRESEARLRGLYESVQAGVVVVDGEGRVVHVNRAAVEMVGASRDPSTGVSVLAPHWRMVDESGAAISPADYPIPYTLRTGQPVRQAVRGVYFGAPERLTWLIVNTEPVRDPASGDLIEVVATFSDITPRMLAESALRESEARFRAAFEHAGSGMARVALDGTLLEANPALAEMLGYQPEEMVGLALADITHPDDLALDLELYAELGEGKRQHYQIEKRYLHRDGHTLWGRLTATVVCDAQGAPLYGLGSVLDVTDQHVAAEALSESETRYRTLFEQTANPILVIDTEGHYLEANVAALRFLALTRDELLAKTVYDLTPPDETSGETFTHHAELWRIGGRADTVYQVGGQQKILDLTITPAQWRGRDVVFGVGRDVTGQRNLEERLREMNKLEAIGQLAGGIAHEFNNLLTVINGCTEMLAETLGPTHAGYGDTQEVLRAGRRAADLVQQLLAFGRRQMVTKEVLDLREVLTHSVTMLRRMLPERVLLDVALAANIGAIRGDPSQFDQILLSLGSNARDAMPTGGTITIRAENVAFDQPYISGKTALEPGRYVLLEMTDAGAGMTDEVIEHLFEPFFTTKGVGKGSGLGMAAVYGIVKQLGGEIEVWSQPDSGTRFRIYLPRIDAPPPVREALPEQAPRAQATVLVVEDEPAVRRLAMRMLRDLGYRALEAVSAQQALAVCRREGGRIALILADVGMPGMSGLEMAKALGPDCPQVPILYMTGYGAQAVAGEQPSTVRGIITKPFTATQLGQWIESILGSNPSDR